MAEETKEAQPQQEPASDTETQGEGQGETKEEVNWEKRYKNLEADHTTTSQKLAEQEQLVELVSPYVDWGKVQGSGEAPSDPEEEGTVDKKMLTTSLKDLSDKVDTKLLTLDFRQAHPELRPYEDTITGPALSRLRRKYPREPIRKVMERAADFTAKFLEEERKKGEETAEKKSQEAAGAGGLGSASPTSPAKKEEPLGETNKDYLARRKAQSRKARGLI